MESMKPDELSRAATSQSRREALKKFGRYAAVAPTAMVLLGPRESHAGLLQTIVKILGSRKRGGGSHY